MKRLWIKLFLRVHNFPEIFIALIVPDFLAKLNRHIYYTQKKLKNIPKSTQIYQLKTLFAVIFRSTDNIEFPIGHKIRINRSGS